jgi:CRP/FNR family transcriptional regulator
VRSTALCGVLDNQALADFRSLGWTLKLAPGQSLFHQGDPATRVFTLTSGTLKLYRLLADGRRQVTGFMHPGDFLGISIDDEHAFSAEALEQTQLCWFPRNRFDDFTEEHGAMEREL